MSFIKTQTTINPQTLKRLIARLAKELPKKSRRRFHHGVAAFSLADYRSLNDASRQLSPKFNTGSSRVYHLLGDISLANRLQSVLIKQALKGRTGRVYINIDYTTWPIHRGHSCHPEPLRPGLTLLGADQ